MPDLIPSLFWLICRYLHVVATTFLLGGTLFYEFVVPMAIGELKTEQQLSVYARARWIFRRVVYFSAAVLMLTGLGSSIRNWPAYNGDEMVGVQRLADPSGAVVRVGESMVFGDPRWLWASHVAGGFLALTIAVLLVSGNTPPSRPRPWLRLNILLLLVAIFLASATRNARLNMFEWIQNPAPALPDDDGPPPDPAG